MAILPFDARPKLCYTVKQLEKVVRVFGGNL